LGLEHDDDVSALQPFAVIINHGDSPQRSFQLLNLSFEQIVGGMVAVIMAGMPAMIALLKIQSLHLAVNSRLEEFIAATKRQNDAIIANLKDQLREAQNESQRRYELLIKMTETPVCERSVLYPKEQLIQDLVKPGNATSNMLGARADAADDQV
jgi:hypothetical protein